MTVGATEDVADFENKMVERFQVKQHGAIKYFVLWSGVPQRPLQPHWRNYDGEIH